MASASLILKSWTCHKQRLMRGTRGSIIPCGLLCLCFGLFRFAFPDGAPLRPWLTSAVNFQATEPRMDPEGWTRRPRLETTALATSTARISSCAHKVIVALIGEAIPLTPLGRRLARRSLISRGSIYRDFTTAAYKASSLCFYPDHGPQTDACTCMQARGPAADTARWARIKARNVASILVAASSCIRQVHRKGTSS